VFLIQINGLEYLIKHKLSVLEACKSLGYTIPRFCYHESLSLSGNCRMCLVEVVGIEKPAASCVTEIENGMKIWLNTSFVKKARENVLEALLLNHPLDCPICDQGGECDLQDQTFKYSIDTSKSFFNKSSVNDKNCGPLIKTIMTRCIHCTRCVRFSTEIAGNEFYGTTLRGGHTEISSYLDKTFNSEISGNVIDLCPVGALTAKIQAFKARPWELKIFEAIDLTDSVGSNIYINYKDNNIVRILPRPAGFINETFISDKARFFFDGLKKNRAGNIFKRDNKKFLNNIKDIYSYSRYKKDKLKQKTVLNKTTWNLLSENFIWSVRVSKNVCLLDNNLGSNFLAFISSFSSRFKNTFSVKRLSSFVSENFFIQNNNGFITDIDTVDRCFLFSSNIRFEACILNLRLRIKQNLNSLTVFNFGNFVSNNIINCFTSSNIFKSLTFLEGKLFLSSAFETSKKKSLFILGSYLNNSGLILNTIKFLLYKLSPESKTIKITSFLNFEGLNFFGIKNLKSKDFKFGNNNYQKNIISLKQEDTFNCRKRILCYNKPYVTNFCWWIASNLSAICTRIDAVLPTHSFFQEADFFFNLEQRPQNSGFVFKPLSESRSFPLYFSRLFFDLNSKFKNTFEHNRYILELKANTELFEINKKVTFKDNLKTKLIYNTLVVYQPLKSLIEDFFLFNTALNKNSKTLQNCSNLNRKMATNFN
jgi:NADH-quinone oxidoreductase subunit G